MPKSQRFPPTLPKTVEILAFPDVQLLDVAGPLQVFASVNHVVAREGGSLPYAPTVVSVGGSVVHSSAGLGLVTGPLTAGPGGPDTLVVAGGQGVDLAARDPDLIDWLRVRASGARRVASVCTGAFLLGAAGILDGRRVATHWTRCAELARNFPKAKVESDPIFVRDGRVWSSAGVTAGIDMALALVEEDLGRTLALTVARHLVMFLKRPGGQAQFSAVLSLQAAEDPFERLHAWIGEHLADDLSVPALSAQAGMSERNFGRRYALATGMTPARAVERLRVEAARRLLSETRLPLKRIAARCGLGTEETVRRSFVRLLSTTPKDYRARFGAWTGKAETDEGAAAAVELNGGYDPDGKLYGSAHLAPDARIRAA